MTSHRKRPHRKPKHVTPARIVAYFIAGIVALYLGTAIIAGIIAGILGS